MGDNLFTYNELESSKDVVMVESKKESAILKVDSQKDNGVSIFENATFGKVRIVLQNGEPLFCLSDIAKVLEIQNGSDIKNALLREFELPRLNLHSFDTGFGIKEFSMITEPQLYFVLMRSNSAKAKPFRQWVTKEVLPSIRKTGSYGVAPKLPQTYKEALRELLNQVEQNEQLQIENAKQQETINDQAEIINAYQVTDEIKRNKQELATLLNRKIRELADLEFNRQYAKCYNEIYKEFAKLHCFTHKVDMQFLRTNIDYLSECLKIVLDKIQNAKEQK